MFIEAFICILSNKKQQTKMIYCFLHFLYHCLRLANRDLCLFIQFIAVRQYNIRIAAYIEKSDIML